MDISRKKIIENRKKVILTLIHPMKRYHYLFQIHHPNHFLDAFGSALTVHIILYLVESTLIRWEYTLNKKQIWNMSTLSLKGRPVLNATFCLNILNLTKQLLYDTSMQTDENLFPMEQPRKPLTTINGRFTTSSLRNFIYYHPERTFLLHSNDYFLKVRKG